VLRGSAHQGVLRHEGGRDEHDVWHVADVEVCGCQHGDVELAGVRRRAVAKRAVTLTVPRPERRGKRLGCLLVLQGRPLGVNGLPPVTGTTGTTRADVACSGEAADGVASECGETAGGWVSDSPLLSAELVAGNARVSLLGSCQADLAIPARITSAAPPSSHSCVWILQHSTDSLTREQ